MRSVCEVRLFSVRRLQLERLGIGIIGCGWIANKVHIPALKSFPEVEIVAVADSNPDRRMEAGITCPGAVAVADYHQLLETPGIEAVFICLPPTLHAEVAIEALNIGKHVYVEKPIAVNSSEARTLVKVWQKTQLVAMIGYNYRFHPLYIDAKKRLQADEIGKPLCVRSVFTAPQEQIQDWKKQRRTGGGALLELASHHLDLMRFLFEAEISDVFCTIQSQHSEQDSVFLQLRLGNGMAAQSFFSIRSLEEDRMEIFGEKGKLSLDRHLSVDVEKTGEHLDLSRAGYVSRQIRSAITNPYLARKLWQPANELSYREAIRAFLAAVRGKPVTAPTVLDGWRSVTVIEAAEESDRTGRVTTPDDVL